MLILALVACRPVPTDAPSETDGPTPADSDTGAARERVWQALHEGPCAMDAEGLVACWWPASWASRDYRHYAYGMTPEQVPVTALNKDLVLWGVARDSGLAVVLVPLPYDYEGLIPELAGFTDLSVDCARHGSDIWCWDTYDGPPPFPAGRSYQRLAGEHLALAALDTTNTLLVREVRYPADDLIYDVVLPPELEVVDLAVVNESGCVLASTGEVSCHGGPLDGTSPLPDPGPYRRFFGRRTSACGVRASDDVLVCNEGTTHAWGPLRDVVLAENVQVVMLAGEPHVVAGEWGDPPSLCAITERNAIRCAGGHYDAPDLQAMLPAGD